MIYRAICNGKLFVTNREGVIEVFTAEEKREFDNKWNRIKRWITEL